MKIKGVSWQWPGINGIGRQHLWFNSLQTGATASDQSAKWQVSTLIMLERPQATLKQWREKERTQKNSEELTSVNCRGQTPTFSPSLASIQCSSTRLMTVRMSPCKPELSNRDTESVRKDEKQINRWNKKNKNQDARCLSVFTLETEHSALKLSEPWVYPAACDINSLYVCRPSAFCSQLLLWKPFDHLH